MAIRAYPLSKVNGLMELCPLLLAFQGSYQGCIAR